MTRKDIASALGGLPDSSRNNVLRALRAVFRFGVDLGYLKELPVRRNDFAEIKRTEIDVLPVGKIRRLLEAALEHDPACSRCSWSKPFAGFDRPKRPGFNGAISIYSARG